MVLRKQKEGADTCRFSVDLQNGKTIRIPLIWYNVLITPHIAVKDAENISERHFEILLENSTSIRSRFTVAECCQ